MILVIGLKIFSDSGFVMGSMLQIKLKIDQLQHTKMPKLLGYLNNNNS